MKKNLILNRCVFSLFHPIGKEKIFALGYGDGGPYHTQHQTDEINSWLLVTYAHSQGEEDTTHTGPHGYCTENRVNKQVLQEAGFVGMRRGIDGLI